MNKKHIVFQLKLFTSSSHSKHLTAGSQETEQDPRSGAHQVGHPKGNERYSQINQRRKDQGEHSGVRMGDP
jgi:hypothetical protein